MGMRLNSIIKIGTVLLFATLIISPSNVAEYQSTLKEKDHNNPIQPNKTLYYNPYWYEQSKLIASDGAPDDRFGCSVSIDGDYAIIGSPYDDGNGSASGSAYIFKSDGATWTEYAKLIASDGAGGDDFGFSVAIDNDYIIIGARGDNNNGDKSGSAYIFKRIGTAWTQQVKLLASDGEPNDYFGWSVSLDGDYAVIGASWDDDNGNFSGSAYIFKRDGMSWIEQTKLLASDGAPDDLFGWSVSIDGDYAIIGAVGDDDNGIFSGSTYAYKRNGTAWIQEEKLIATDGEPTDCFGWSVSLDGNYALIGAVYDDGHSGSAYIFKCIEASWIQEEKLLASDGEPYDRFGCSVSIDGDYALIGAPSIGFYQDDFIRDVTSSAYIFKYNGTTWIQEQILKSPDGPAHINFGFSVSIDGDFALIGADCDDDNGDNSGSAFIFVKSEIIFDIEIIGGLGVEMVFTNDGSFDLYDIYCNLKVEGGIFNKIDERITEFIDIPAGESKTISTELLFGFGRIDVEATVNKFIKTTSGFQFIIYSRMKPDRHL